MMHVTIRHAVSSLPKSFRFAPVFAALAGLVWCAGVSFAATSSKPIAHVTYSRVAGAVLPETRYSAPADPAAKIQPDTSPVAGTTPTLENFGTINVGSTSTAATITVTFDTSDTLSSIAVVTQGIASLDFNQASTGTTCTTGVVYAATTTCNVTVTFAPKYSGARYGAVVLTDNNNAVVATGYLQGIGGGPQQIFLPGSSTTLASSVSSPRQIAVDAAGNVYFASGTSIYKETYSTSGYTQSTIGSGLSGPYGVAVDGAGNIYVADSSARAVWEEVPNGSGGYTQQEIVQGLQYGPVAIAVDGAGDLFLSIGTSSVIEESLVAGNYVSQSIGSFSDAWGIAVDARGNVYVGDVSLGKIFMETPSVSGYTQSTVASSIYYPYGVAVDGAGNVYATMSLSNSVVRVGPILQTTLAQGFNLPQGVAVDQAGNLYVSDFNNSRAIMINFQAPFALNFATTPYATTSSDSPRTASITNIGTVPLNFSAVTFPSDFPESANATNVDCAKGTVLQAAGTCTFTVDFTPMASIGTGSSVVLNENVTASTNNLNVTTPITLPVSGVEVKATPTVGLNASVNPVVVGSKVTFTAYVSGRNGAIPAGSVTFYNYNTLLGSVALSSGAASFSTSTLPLGKASITAVYNGSNVYSAATSNTVSESVILLTPAITLTSSPNPAAPGYSVTFTVVVDGTAGYPIPTGTVKIAAAGIPALLGTVTLAHGVATFATNKLPLGTTSITATYSGNSIYATEPSAAVQQVVALLTPTVTLAAAPNPVPLGTPFTVTATVSGPAGVPIPTGTVNFEPLGSATLNGGIATFTTTLPLGTYAITADYNGGTIFAPAVSNVVDETIVKPSPPLTLTTSANPVAAGAAVTFKATVAAVGTSGIPAGTVIFSTPSSVLGTVTLNSSGVASLTTTTLPMGSYLVSATYTGSTIYASTTSTVIDQIVLVPSFSPVAVGATSTVLIPVAMSATGTLSAIHVITQGLSGKDFNPAATGGTCAVGKAYAVGAICTVNVTFSPLQTGTRMGAIQFVDSDGDVIGSSYLQGSGQGPQTSFSPANQSTIGSGWITLNGIAVDGNGTVYVADAGTGDVYKETLTLGQWIRTTIDSGLNAPEWLAVDGAGNVFVADVGTGQIYEEILLNGNYNESTVYNEAYATSLAVDSSGNLYFTGGGSGPVYKLTPTGGGQYASSSIGYFSSGHGVAVDGAGNVYVADAGTDLIYMESWIDGGYVQSNVVSHHVPTGVAVDGNGNIYVTSTNPSNQQSGMVYKETPLYGAFTESIIASGLGNPAGLAVDGSGRVYVTDSQAMAVYEEDAADPPTMNFASTTLGSESSDSPQTMTVSNIGNTTLKFSALTYATDFRHALTGVNDCGASTLLAPGASCPVDIEFLPVTSLGTNSAQELSEPVTVTTNTLNVAGTAQAATMNGTEVPIQWSVKLTASSTTIVVGSPITFTATVTAYSSSAPSGFVNFYSGKTLLVQAPFSGDTATAVIASLPVGSEAITAVYSNTTSNAITVGITAATAGAVLTASATQATLGKPLSFKMAVTGKQGVAIPTGTVTLYSGATVLGEARLVKGAVSFSTNALKPGIDTIRGVYSGDANYLSTISNSVWVKITSQQPVNNPLTGLAGPATDAKHE